MNQRLNRLRRVGVAAIAGVTALGAAAIVGEGVAAAAVPTVSASAATANSILASGTGAGSALTLTITGTISTSDSIVLQTACSTTLVVASAVTSSGSNWNAVAGKSSTCAVDNEVVLTPASSSAVASFTVTPSYTATAATPGAVALSGSYVSTTGTTTFAVPSDATVVAVGVTGQTPLTSVPTSATNAAIGNITVSSVFYGPTPGTVATPGGSYVCVTLPAASGTTFNTTSAPTVTQINGASTTGGGTLVSAGTVAASANVLSFLVTGTAVSTPPTFLLSNLHVNSLTTGGPVVATVATAGTAAGCSATPAPATLGSGTVFTVGAVTAPIYGQNADDTTAAAFNAAFVQAVPNSATNTVSYTCNNNGNAVVATDAAPYDSLSAAYLEGQLHTGVLITSPTSLSSAVVNELKMAGVQRVYVVGGPLAVSSTVINAIKALPAYTCGGLALTGANVQVYSGIYGQTADETAVAIGNYITSTTQIPMNINYANAAKYNTTTGNASTTAPAVTGKAAILVSDTDYRDAAAIAGLSWANHIPIVLTTPTTLSATASAQLVKLGVNQVIAVGGPLALSNAVVTSVQALNGGVSVLRVAGADYTATAANLALLEGTELGWTNSTVYVAQGQGWSDSLGAAGLVGMNHGALLLTEGPTQGVGKYTTAALNTAGNLATNGLGGGVTSSIQVLGGPLAVPASQVTEMNNALLAG